MDEPWENFTQNGSCSPCQGESIHGLMTSIESVDVCQVFCL